MKTPFPGMDPYLEHHTIWPDVHNRLIIALADELSPVVAPNYYIGVESRAYVIKPEGDQFLGRPDISIVAPFGAMPATAVALPVGAEVAEVEMPAPDEISHYYLEVRSVHSHELITLIELLSPVNKIDAEGRLMYMRQRYETLASCTSLIEIDLLRAGEPLPPQSKTPSYYRTLVSRG
ncbi:MAG: DUF4058 family protein [Anaerolineales bacterium]|nr:DUF4058 family protein [Anaerolineales bacterium]